jgi:hypothetical protein
LDMIELFDRVANTLKIEFEYQAKILGHPGEVGTGRENVLKRVLSKYIPKRYVVDSGFVVDASVKSSEQMDIVIYEANYTPVFEIVEGKSFFPCETVVAVGQVRTKIGSRKEMQECLNNIKSVKELDRSNKGTNELITGPGISFEPLARHFDPNKNFRDQIFGFIFCSSSIKRDSMISELQKFNKQNERKLWTNIVVNYNEFLIEYKDEFLTQDPMKAQKFVLIDKSQNPHILGLFVSILNNFLNMAHIARPNLFAYCKLDEIHHYEFPLW